MDDRYRVAGLVSIVVVLFVAVVGVGNGQGVGYIPSPVTSDSIQSGFAYDSQIIPQISALSQDQLPEAQASTCMCPCVCTPVPPSPPTPTAEPLPTIVPPSPGGLKMVYQGPLTDFMPADLNSTWGHGFSVLEPVLPDQVQKLNYVYETNWVDPYRSGVNYSGKWTMDAIRSFAKSHPTNWWIVGEEVNFWSPYCNSYRWNRAICKFPDGREYPAPHIYARWLRDVTNAIKAGWADAGGNHGEIVGFYFGPDDVCGGICGMPWNPTKTYNYLGLFYQEWAGRGFGPVPFVAVDYNHRPPCATWEDEGGGIEQSTAYWTAKHSEMLARSWLADKVMWIETDRGRRYPNNPPTIDDYCDVAKRVANLIAWADGKDWVGGFQLFSTVYGDWLSTSLMSSSMYYSTDNKGNTTPGNLTPVGMAFRDRAIPDVCK